MKPDYTLNYAADTQTSKPQEHFLAQTLGDGMTEIVVIIRSG